MGSTSWRSWDGTEEGAAAAIDEEVYIKPRMSPMTRAGWETEFDR